MTSNGVSTYNLALSRREVKLLSDWERERRLSITIDDIRQRTGAAAAKDVARALVRKGVLLRIQRGLYVVRPLRSLLRPSVVSSATATAALLRAQPYYLGGLWAFSFHGLIRQQTGAAMDAFVTRRLLPRRIAGAKVTFHRVPASALDYGIEDAAIEGVTIRVSDVERTLLDALDHPRAVGNLRHGIGLFQAGLPRADRRRLIAYASRGSRSGTCQRLGVLLERIGTPARWLSPLRRRTHETRSLLSMLPDAPRSGLVNDRWGVVENDS
jgi:predicted transcriptional regulator of viral defense system